MNRIPGRFSFFLVAALAIAAAPCAPQTKKSPHTSPGQALARVTNISAHHAGNHTRVVIRVENSVEYSAAQISDPDRIYVDVQNAKISSQLAGKILDVNDGIVRKVRAAQNQMDVVRVVLDADKAGGYSVALMPDPYRLVVDVFGPQPAPAATAVNSSSTNQQNAAAAGIPVPLATPGGVASNRGAVNAASTPAEAAPGPLVVSSANPRYFTDGGGRAVYLTGSHHPFDLQDSTESGEFDFDGFLNLLQTYNHNFFRLWVWESASGAPWTEEEISFSPLPYARTAPENAIDGGPKFDLTTFNDEFFDRLRSRVAAAGERGIYVSIMLFQGWSIGRKSGFPGNPWPGHPFNSENNVNEIIDNPVGVEDGDYVHTLQVPAITALQEAYVKRVIDTVNDLDNVLYEISNESPTGSEDWQYHFVDFIHSYEATKPKQHPVMMSVEWPGGGNATLFASAAEAISPNDDDDYTGEGGGPPAASGQKVIISDTDHLFRDGGSPSWAWKTFTRGLNPISAEDDDSLVNANSPRADVWVAMGQTRGYATRLDLLNMTPRGDLASSNFCLANPNHEYLVYLPEGGDVSVNLSDSSGVFAVEWFNPGTGETFDRGAVTGGTRFFTAPFQGHAVLYLLRK
jgi:hypothetical protein